MGLPILSPHSDPLNVYDQETFHHNEAGHKLVTRPNVITQSPERSHDVSEQGTDPKMMAPAPGAEEN